MLVTGASYNAINRYRMALIGLFAVATSLQMWAANVLLNLSGMSTFYACSHAAFQTVAARPKSNPCERCAFFCERVKVGALSSD